MVAGENRRETGGDGAGGKHGKLIPDEGDEEGRN